MSTGIHAREWVAPASVTYIIKELVENRKNLPSELLNLDFYIVPVLNPDGYEYTHTRDRMWRKNRSRNGRCYGADVNRNFNFHFGGEGTSGDSCSEIYRGRSANSELESQALSNFLLKIKRNLKVTTKTKNNCLGDKRFYIFIHIGVSVPLRSKPRLPFLIFFYFSVLNIVRAN